jgi:tRNA(Ile)-lysidine synthase
MDVAFTALSVDASPRSRESPEAVARQVRYQALAKLLGPKDAVLTAHHRDDQGETLLLQLLRGSGPHGLAAMPAAASLGQGLLLRPLLNTPRNDILTYAKAHDLYWVEDTSNADLAINRNYLRHTVLPLMKAHWPAAIDTMARSARLCAEASQLLDELADMDLAQVTDGDAQRLSIARLCKLTEARQRNCLRRWFRMLNLASPNAAQLHHILQDVLNVPPDRQPHIHWPGGEVRRYKDHLFAMQPLPFHDPNQVFPMKITLPLSIPYIGYLCLLPTQGQGLNQQMLDNKPLHVGFWRGGERFQPVGRAHSQTLKKLFQAAGVPPWERDRLPLLYVDDTLAAVGELWISAQFAARADEKGLIFTWQKDSPFVNV